jgi:hypothetical protein
VHLKLVSPFREYGHVLLKNSVSDLHRAYYNSLLPQDKATLLATNLGISILSHLFVKCEYFVN